MDTINHLVSTLYGETVSDTIANIMEYEAHKDASRDPFAEVFKLTSITP